MMKAILQDEPGDERTLYLGETNIPIPSDDEVLIKVSCTALNRMDLLQCRGKQSSYSFLSLSFFIDSCFELRSNLYFDILGSYPLPPGASKILGVEVTIHFLLFVCLFV